MNAGKRLLALLCIALLLYASFLSLPTHEDCSSAECLFCVFQSFLRSGAWLLPLAVAQLLPLVGSSAHASQAGTQSAVPKDSPISLKVKLSD